MEKSELEQLEKIKPQNMTEALKVLFFNPRCGHVMTGDLINMFCSCGYNFVQVVVINSIWKQKNQS